MTPARLQTVEEIFHAALDQEADQVARFVKTSCEGDELLRREVEALLASHQRAGSFIESSTTGIARRIIGKRQADLLVGQTFGHYKISKRIGRGGMGEVYLAIDVTAGRKAALKILPPRFTGDVERLKRFQQEAHAVVALNHPNILTVYEIGEDPSTHYIASELIEGETLRQRLRRDRMEIGEAVDVAIQVASALVAAHGAGIVHRDINPGNIMLRPDGYVKVLDFGIAKLAQQKAPAPMPKDKTLLGVETNLGSVVGTVPYMSPEQVCGEPVDKGTDIWSLGVVVYEMVTRHRPFVGNTPSEVMTSILEKEPSPLRSYIKRTPAELQQIISKALRKDRRERHQSVSEMLEKFRNLRRKLESEAELLRFTTPTWLRWTRSPAAVAILLLGLAVALAFPFYRHRNLSTSLPPDKSIAVLPLENLSNVKENAYFADGIQDELLSTLAKIRDLKVISRASVMQYKSGIKRNLKEIARQLGVSNVVEGSVRRSGDHVRVSVQLIDARTDTHLWAERYDRNVTDIFAIQTDIAQQIAGQLQARLSPAEKAAIGERLTADLLSFALYTKAETIDVWHDWEGAEKSMLQKVDLLGKATQRDPTSALAYCALAKAHCDLGTHLELAKKAADTALRLRPDLGEGHRELARYYFSVHDFDRAYDELTVARRTLPNDSEVLRIAAQTDRHRNRWNDALANFQRASELDPRNDEIIYHLGLLYREMRRCHEWEQLLGKDAANRPGFDPWSHLALAEIKLDMGDPVAAQSLLEEVPLDFSPTEEIWAARFTAALYLRDYDSANRVIAATPAKFADFAFDGPSDWAYGQIARARGDQQTALAAFIAARKKEETMEATRGYKPEEDAPDPRGVARLDAGLGRRADAIREALRAVELMPIAKDSCIGPGLVTNLALVYAWTGERDHALDQLEIVAKIPAGPSYGDLRFNPCWDDLRGDKRFDKIVAAAKAASR